MQKLNFGNSNFGHSDKAKLVFISLLILFTALTRLMFAEKYMAFNSPDSVYYFESAGDYSIADDRPHLPGYYLYSGVAENRIGNYRKPSFCDGNFVSVVFHFFCNFDLLPALQPVQPGYFFLGNYFHHHKPDGLVLRACFGKLHL
jgi:hypothetical protein